MGKTAKFGATEKEQIRGQHLDAFTFNVYLQHASNNIAFTGQPIDFSKVNFSVNLKRGGREIKIYDGILLPWLLESGYFNGDFDQVNGVSSSFRILTAHGASNPAIIMITGTVKLHGILNISDEDVLTVELNPLAEAVGATVNSSVSYIAWDWVETIGNELSIPTVDFDTIEAGAADESFSLGDNVQSVYFVNNDKSGVTTANQVLSSMNVRSKELNRRDSYYELLGKRSREFYSLAHADARHQSFMLIDVKREKMTGLDVRLSQVNVDLNFVAANVTSSKNWLVYRAWVNDAETVRRSVARHNKHAAKNKAQYL